MRDDGTMGTGDCAKRDVERETAPDPPCVCGKFGVALSGSQKQDAPGVRFRPVGAERGAAGLTHAQQRKRQRGVLIEQPVAKAAGLVSTFQSPKATREGIHGRTHKGTAEKMSRASKLHFHA